MCWRSNHPFPHLTGGSAGFFAFLNPRINRPTACTYLRYVLLDQYYLYVLGVFVRSFRPLLGVFVRFSLGVFVRAKLPIITGFVEIHARLVKR